MTFGAPPFPARVTCSALICYLRRFLFRNISRFVRAKQSLRSLPLFHTRKRHTSNPKTKTKTNSTGRSAPREEKQKQHLQQRPVVDSANQKRIACERARLLSPSRREYRRKVTGTPSSTDVVPLRARSQLNEQPTPRRKAHHCRADATNHTMSAHATAQAASVPPPPPPSFGSAISWRVYPALPSPS